MVNIAHCEYEAGEFLIELDYRCEGERSTIKVTRKLITDGKIDPGYRTERIDHDRIVELPQAVIADYRALHQSGFIRP